MKQDKQEEATITQVRPGEPQPAAAPAPGQPADAPGRPQGESERVARMGTGSIPKLVVEFAVPSVVGMVVNGSYALISSAFLGLSMGEIGLSTVTVAGPTLVVFMAFAMLFGNGGNALAALRLGAGKRQDAERVLGNVVTLSIVISLLVAAAVTNIDVLNWILTVSSTTEDVRPYAQDYVRILSYGFIFQCIGMGVNNFIRTCGAPLRALVTMVVGLVVSAVVNYLLVMVLGWGVVGSALASIIGQACSCACVLWFFLGVKEAPLHLSLRNMVPRPRLLGDICLLGLPSFAIQVGMALINFLLNFQLVKYGALSPIGAQDALASIGVVQRIGQFSVMPLIGIAVSIQPLLGYNYGAGNIARVRKTYKCGVIGASAFAVVLWACIYLFTEPIVSAFGITNAGLNEFTVFAMRVQFVTFLIVGYQITSSNYFQATGQPWKSIFLSLTRQIVFLIPLIAFLPELLPVLVPQLNGLDALYFAQPIADVFAFTATTIFVVWELRRLRKIERGELELKRK